MGAQVIACLMVLDLEGGDEEALVRAELTVMAVAVMMVMGFLIHDGECGLTLKIGRIH